MLSDEMLLRAVRLALRQLYDTHALCEGELATSLGWAGLPQAASDIRRLLAEAIAELQPAADTPSDSELWRAYEILQYRFVQQCSQAEVARQLGLSIRHLRRAERKAAEVLAAALRNKLPEPAAAAPGSAAPPRVVEPAWPDEPADSDQNVQRELEWLDRADLAQEFDLGELLEAVALLARPLAQQHGAELQIEIPPVGPLLSSQPVALRQLILSLLSVAVERADQGAVCMEVALTDKQACVHITAQAAGCVARRSDGLANIAMAHRLASPCGAQLTLHDLADGWEAEVVLTLPRQIPVLVIDDNQDTIRLLQRYLAGTRYRLVAAANLDEALSAAGQTHPRVVLLDVMMPHMDGWEVLGRLRQHPLTRQAPVVVCSILAQQELARALGASDYVLKPITRAVLLAALDRQVGPEEPVCRTAPAHSSETLAD